MNNEIKEILEQLEWYRKIGKKDVYYPECVLPNKKAFLLLDYITNLQQKADILEETNATLIQQKYDLERELDGCLEKKDNLQQIEQEHQRINGELREELTNLQQENERLKEWKEDLLKENIELENIRKEVIEYMQENYNELTDYGYKKEIYDYLLNILQNGSDSQ